MRAVLLLVLFAAAAGCGGTPPDQKCRKTQGAHWECDNSGANCRCAEPTTDGGKPCFDKSQCQGRCIMTGGTCDDPNVQPTGTCESIDSHFGCQELVKTVHDPVNGDVSVCESSCP